MQRRKKQLLGLVGLVLVAIITAIACALPTPDASAYQAETKVTVQVGTIGKAAAARFTSLKDKSTVVHKTFEVSIEYTNANRLQVYLVNRGNILKDQADRQVELSTDSCNITYSQNAQTCTLNFNLADAGLWTSAARTAQEGQNIDWPYGTAFTAKVTAYNNESATPSPEDAVNFTYRSAYLKDYSGEKEANGDPIMHAVIGNVEKVLVQVYDSNNKPIFVNADGSDAPLSFAKGEYGTDGNNDYKFTLPLTDFGAKAGKYTVILTGYDNENTEVDTTNIVAISTLENVPYKTGGSGPSGPSGPSDPSNPDDPNQPSNPDDPSKPDEPEVPGTGVRLFDGMNISSADYIVTGLVAFGMVTMFAVFLIIRRSKRH